MEQEQEYDKTNEEFPDCEFTIDIPYNELDEVFTDKEEIVLKYCYNCYCYDRVKPRNTEYIVVKKGKENKGITYRMCILEMCKVGFNTGCNHQFFEGLVKTTDIQYDIYMGS